MRSGAGSPNSSHAGKLHLHRAIHGGKVDAMDALISLGADVTRPAPHGKTTLHLAASTSGSDVIARLLDLGCDVNARDAIQGSTPLHVACAYCNRAAVLTLLIRDAEFNAVNHCRQTPLSKLLEPVTKADDFHNTSRLILARELVSFGLILQLEVMDRDQPERDGACSDTLHTGTKLSKPYQSSRRQLSGKLKRIYQGLIQDLAPSLSLKQWCRLTVLKSVGHRPLADSIKQLKVPTLVQTFILQGHRDLSGLRH
ncbi:ankyrin repeat and EF-hand domain-containing protein 1-like [Physella acuta]|uniref:ankyrin repeat and EF-hand domain-containing protein 1-like n=1 Tax=Physella acuta TaxID=109671 RepID=UPI0027DDC879|nr:ankyrin repeat and EF-hand domain-containing protein 1-like [Physella acuta]